MTQSSPDGEPSKWSTGKKFLVGVVVLAVAGFVLWKPALKLIIWASGGMSMTKAVDNRPLGYFYRFQANFSRKGEALNFDYVVACSIRVTSYRGGGLSNDSTFTPRVMMMPTSDGGAIMLRNVNACDAQSTANGMVPETLLPMAIWFDDVNDMTFGWGYATEDAYENTLSQLEFLGATITGGSTREEWEAWREASAKNFKPIGMITTPWGVNYNEIENIRFTDKPYDTSKRVLARVCSGYFRLKLPENIRADVRAYWPDERPRYWSPSPKTNIREILDKGGYPGGNKFKHYLTGVLGSGIRGLPRRKGNATLGPWINVVTGVYPVLPRSRSMTHVIDKPADVYPRRLVYDNGRMKGFLACGGDGPFDTSLPGSDPAFRNKFHPIYVDDDRAVDNYNPLGLPVYIFDRDEHVFRINPAGRH